MLVSGGRGPWAAEVVWVALLQCKSEPPPRLLVSCRLNPGRGVGRLLWREEVLKSPFHELPLVCSARVWVLGDWSE